MKASTVECCLILFINALIQDSIGTWLTVDQHSPDGSSRVSREYTNLDGLMFDS